MMNRDPKIDEKCSALHDFAKANGCATLIVAMQRVNAERIMQQGGVMASASVDGTPLEIYHMMCTILIGIAEGTGRPLNIIIDEFSRFCYDRDFWTTGRS